MTEDVGEATDEEMELEGRRKAVSLRRRGIRSR